MIAAKTMGANVATKKREIPAQQKQGEIQVKIIALAAAVTVPRLIQLFLIALLAALFLLIASAHAADKPHITCFATLCTPHVESEEEVQTNIQKRQAQTLDRLGPALTEDRKPQLPSLEEQLGINDIGKNVPPQPLPLDPIIQPPHVESEEAAKTGRNPSENYCFCRGVIVAAVVPASALQQPT
jgi:hypothetical protein